MTRIATFILILAFAFGSALAEGNNDKTVKILTNAHCGACKTKIENKLNGEAGVLGSKLNLDDKIVEVRYNAEKTDPSKLTNAIASLKFEAKVVEEKSADKKMEASSSKECGSSKGCCSHSSKKSSKSCSTSESCGTSKTKSKSSSTK